MFRLPDEYAQILRELPDRAENAFYWRERRRAARRGEPWRAATNVVVLLATVFGLSFAGLWTLLSLGAFEHGRTPEWLGGQDGGRATFALVAAVHALLVSTTARGMVNGILAGEARRGTLFQVLMTRIPAFEMILQIAVFPFQQSAIVALAGLPFYILLVAFGSVGLQEVFVLYLLFLLMAIVVPSWRTPALSEQSPEEMGKILHSQSRSAGCAAFAVTFALIPGSIMMGSFLYVVHLLHPQGAARIPADVWPALPAIPLTFAWVVVRVLTAPYTWFGLPLPPWVWIVPVLLLIRLTALWSTSFYLRVAHPAQIFALPDMKFLAAWRAGIRMLACVGLVGYLWQPTLEMGFVGGLFWPAPVQTAAQNLAGMFYVLAVVGLCVSLDRARKFGLKPPERKTGSRAAILWILGPLLPLGIGLLAGMLGSPGAFFSRAVGTTLLQLLPAAAACLFLAASLGPGSGSVWQALFVLPLLLPLVPISAVAALGSLSPLVAMASINPALRAWFAQALPLYHLPPAWTGALVPLAAGLLCRYLWSTGRVGRPEPTAQRLTLSGAQPPVPAPAHAAASHPGPMAPGPMPSVVWTPVPQDGGLEFILDGLGPAPGAAAVTHSAPPIAAPPSPAALPMIAPRPVVVPPPIIAPRPSVAPPPIVAPAPVALPLPAPAYRGGSAPAAYGQAPVAAGWTPRPPETEWRRRPLSPAAAAIMRWLVRRTDNPVAIYSARRVLPGTLATDALAIGVGAALLGLLMAFVFPYAFWMFVLPPLLTPLLFPSLQFAAADDPAYGLAMLIAAMVIVTLLSPMRVCLEVASGFRMERERATLGFLLATPLSSVGIAVGHCVGAVLPALMRWAGTAALALIPTIILANLGHAGPALWAWGLGFSVSLLYLTLCAVTGAWIGLTEEKARDMTVGVYLLPAFMCLLGGFAALYLWLNRQWSYEGCIAVFLAITVGLLLFLCRDTLNELRKMRHGDLPFEGRSVGN